MDKAMNYLSLARKGGLAELGEEPVGAAARAGKACLILVAEDASDHTWRRAQSYAAGTDQQCVRIPASKDRMGQAIGREALSIAAITDPSLALALINALPEPEKYGKAAAVLTEKVKKGRQRRAEAKAHERNKRRGRSRGCQKTRHWES